MPRRLDESVTDWHARATGVYLDAARDVATQRDDRDHRWDPPVPGVAEAFADLYAASKAVLAKEDPSDAGRRRGWNRGRRHGRDRG